MNINDAMDAYTAAEEALWAHFGMCPLPYNICDCRESPWLEQDQEIGWREPPGELEAQQENSDDPDDLEFEYAGEFYGTSIWRSDTHTIAILDNGGGSRDAYLFLNSKRIG